MRDDRSCLLDMLEAMERIEKYASKGRTAFDSDELIQTWIIYHVQIIGEAVGKLSDSMKSVHAEIPWSDIKKMRNVLVHFYFGINPDKVWNTVVRDLPVLKNQIENILKQP